MYRVGADQGPDDLLTGESFTKDQIETLAVVLETYDDKPGRWLRELCHTENPWKEARKVRTGSTGGSKRRIAVDEEIKELVYSDTHTPCSALCRRPSSRLSEKALTGRGDLLWTFKDIVD